MVIICNLLLRTWFHEKHLACVSHGILKEKLLHLWQNWVKSYILVERTCAHCVMNWKLAGVLLHLKQENSGWKRRMTSAILETSKPKGYLLATYARALNKQRNMICLFKVEKKVRVSDLILTGGKWSIFAAAFETTTWRVLIFCFY